MAVAYFTIPFAFDDCQSGTLAFKFTSIKEGTTELLTSDYQSEISFSYTNDLKYNQTNNNFNSLTNTLPYNIWNPIEETQQLDFDTLTNYGQSTGTKSGSNYGAWQDKIRIDKVAVVDGFGGFQYGCFGFEFNDNYDFTWKARIATIVGNNISRYNYTAKYIASSNTFTYERLTFAALIGTQPENIINYGWLENTAVLPASIQDGNVNKYIGKVLSIPEVTEQDREYDVCCPCSMVLADPIDSDSYKNDFFGAYHYVKNTESVTWKLYKDGIEIDDTSLATLTVLNDLQTYIINWQDVLNQEGEALYKVSKTINVNGFELYTQFYNELKLRQFTWDLADQTVRIDSFFNNKLENEVFSFYNSDFKSSIRIVGKFGNENYDVVTENDLNSDFNTLHNYTRIESNYTLDISKMRDCIWTDIPNLYLLADNIQITDYSQKSYSYKFRSYKVLLESFEEVEYAPSNRQAAYKLKFKDSKNNKIGKYDG